MTFEGFKIEGLTPVGLFFTGEKFKNGKKKWQTSKYAYIDQIEKEKDALFRYLPFRRTQVDQCLPSSFVN